MTTRQAYVARHPFLPGAYAYLNAQQLEAGQGMDTLERWLKQGATVSKVPLAEAIDELHRYLRARRASSEDLPVFLRKQAD
jgi:ferric-dicitrate binding protein FerR (iron transport regulator)